LISGAYIISTDTNNDYIARHLEMAEACPGQMMEIWSSIDS
jgi:hypothetical protein